MIYIKIYIFMNRMHHNFMPLFDNKRSGDSYNKTFNYH